MGTEYIITYSKPWTPINGAKLIIPEDILQNVLFALFKAEYTVEKVERAF